MRFRLLFLHVTMYSLIVFSLMASSFILVSASTPFVVLHGIGDSCTNGNVEALRRDLSDLSKSNGFCLEIGDGSNDSWLKPLQEQVAIACNKVKQMTELQQGYNIVGQSQGNMIARGVVEFCDGGPPVRNYVSLAGPHAGIASVPCKEDTTICAAVDQLIKSEIYSDFVQDHLAPSGYIKLPNNIMSYLSKSKFLPILNNELPNARNDIFKQRLASLKNLVLIMFNNDTTLIPKETSLFGFYPDGAFTPVLAPQETKLYTEDWIGLKTLDDSGRVKYIRVAGDHLQISIQDLSKYVVPYLTG